MVTYDWKNILFVGWNTKDLIYVEVVAHVIQRLLQSEMISRMLIQFAFLIIMIMCFLCMYLKGSRVVNSCLESSGMAEKSYDAWRDHIVFVNLVVQDFKTDLGLTRIHTHSSTAMSP